MAGQTLYMTGQTLYFSDDWTYLRQGLDRDWTEIGFLVQSLSNQPSSRSTEMSIVTGIIERKIFALFSSSQKRRGLLEKVKLF